MRKTSIALMFLLLVPTFAAAERAKDSWDNLKQLRPGQKIEVEDTKMHELRGEFVSFSDDAIVLREGKTEKSVARAEAVRVSVRDTSHRTRNMLLGAGIGGGIAIGAVIVPLVISSNEGTKCNACYAAIPAGVGAGVGLGLIPGSRTIYRVRK